MRSPDRAAGYPSIEGVLGSLGGGCGLLPTNQPGTAMIPTYSMIVLPHSCNSTTPISKLRVWSAVMRAAFGDCTFKPGLDFLFDNRSGGVARRSACINAEAEFYHANKKQMGRWAFVVKGLLSFGMGRMRAGLAGLKTMCGSLRL